jgi:ribonuclease BN (tRNA processing enzyme)
MCLMLPEVGVVLDAGTGMYRVRDHLATPTLDIFVTHAHLDHVIGLTFLFDVIFGRDLARVTVHGEADKLTVLERHLFAPELFPAKPPFEWQPLSGTVELPREGRLSWFPLEHPGGSVGFRLDWADRSLAYVTDTTARRDAAYVEKIRGVDLLVHECYFPDGWENWAEKTGHSCISRVLEVAEAAQPRRLVLVHVNPLATEDDPLGLTLRTLPLAVEYGEDGQEIEF